MPELNLTITDIMHGDTPVLKIMKGDTQKWPIPYKNQYLTFKALEMGTFQFTEAINYSINGGEWTELAAATDTPTLEPGDKIRWKGTLSVTFKSGIGTFSSTGKFNVYGNPYSCYLGDNFKSTANLKSNQVSVFSRLFKNCTYLVNAENLALISNYAPEWVYSEMFYGCTSLVTIPELPATSIGNHCYYQMFRGCTSLVTSPVLTATTLTEACYGYMFYGCSSLKTPPVLSATTLATRCYEYMFYGCTVLEYCPALPATGTMPNYCYSYMFQNCKQITTAPELSGTTLTTGSYAVMFKGCSNLNYVKCLATSISATVCLYDWMNSVASGGTFVKHPDNTSWPRTANGIPSSWTVEDAVLE